MNVLTKEEKEKLLKQIDRTEHIEKAVAFSWDGTNLLVRFPKEIAQYLNINKDNRFTKKLKFILESKEEIIKQTFEIIDKIGEKNASKKTSKNKQR